MTASQDVRDELVEQDIRVRRVSARLERDVQKRLLDLQREVVAEMSRIDPAGAVRTDARERRLQRTEQAVRELTRNAYADIESMTANVIERAAVADQAALTEALKKAIP